MEKDRGLNNLLLLFQIFQITLKMMKVPVSEHPPFRSRSVRSGDSPQEENLPNLSSGLRVFSCRVGVARELMVQRAEFPVMWRMYGSLVSITSRTTGSKELILTDLHGSNVSIHCFFQEVDRRLGEFRPGESVVVTGVVRAGDVVQAVEVETFDPDTVLPYISRLEYFARRALQQ